MLLPAKDNWFHSYLPNTGFEHQAPARESGATSRFPAHPKSEHPSKLPICFFLLLQSSLAIDLAATYASKGDSKTISSHSGAAASAEIMSFANRLLIREALTETLPTKLFM